MFLYTAPVDPYAAYYASVQGQVPAVYAYPAQASPYGYRMYYTRRRRRGDCKYIFYTRRRRRGDWKYIFYTRRRRRGEWKYIFYTNLV